MVVFRYGDESRDLDQGFKNLNWELLSVYRENWVAKNFENMLKN